MEEHCCLNEDVQYQGMPLLVGVPAVGNVGQLAVDLLICNSAAQKCAVLESPDVLPIFGHGAYSASKSDSSSSKSEHPSIVTSLEIYRTKTEEGWCYILQQRGPVATGRQVAFSQSLTDWIVKSGFSSTLLLSSVDAGFRGDAQLQGPPLCSVSHNCEPIPGVPAAPVADLGTKALEDRRVAPWPLYRMCCAAEVPTALLMAYAADGNNIPEALLLAAASAPAIPAGVCPNTSEGAQWHMPPSWATLVSQA
eukprot:jgi/Ulvmu1/2638/UM014_0090.1